MIRVEKLNGGGFCGAQGGVQRKDPRGIHSRLVMQIIGKRSEESGEAHGGGVRFKKFM